MRPLLWRLAGIPAAESADDLDSTLQAVRTLYVGMALGGVLAITLALVKTGLERALDIEGGMPASWFGLVWITLFGFGMATPLAVGGLRRSLTKRLAR